MKKRSKKKKTTKRKTKEKIIKTIWNLCAYFISFGFANAASQQLPQGHRCPGGGSSVERGKWGKHLRQRFVPCFVVSSWFSSSFLFFSVPTWCHLFCSSIYTICTHIYTCIDMYMQARVGVVFIFGLAKRFHAFLERKLKQFECTIARWHDGTRWCLRWAPDAISRTTKSARNRKKLFPIILG